MAGLAGRVGQAIKGWTQDRRDNRLFKDFLASPLTRDQLKDQAAPTTQMLMILIEKFVVSELDKAELQLDGHTASCESPVEFEITLSQNIMQMQNTVDLTRRIDNRDQRNLIFFH